VEKQSCTFIIYRFYSVHASERPRKLGFGVSSDDFLFISSTYNPSLLSPLPQCLYFQLFHPSSMSRPSDFAHANLDEVVDALNLAEAIDLVGGVGFWNTAAVPRLGIPTIKVRGMFLL
jgi:hypothetical protein